VLRIVQYLRSQMVHLEHEM